MRRSHQPSRNLPTEKPRNLEAAFLENIAALAEKRSSLLHEEAKLWSQVSLIFAEFASSATSMNFARGTMPVGRDGERPHIFNVTEAAKFLRLSPGTLNGWRLTGGGPEFVRLGRRIFYRADVLERFVQEKSYPHTSAYGHERYLLSPVRQSDADAQGGPNEIDYGQRPKRRHGTFYSLRERHRCRGLLGSPGLSVEDHAARRPCGQRKLRKLLLSNPRTIVALGCGGVLMVGLSVFVRPTPLLLYNPSPSEPIGFYRASSAAPTVGQLISFKVPQQGRAVRFARIMPS